MAQGRRVRRVVRKIDTWSVLKVSSLFFGSVVLVFLIAGGLLWAAGSVVGAVGGFEKFMSSIGFEDFTFSVGQLLRGFVAFGLVVVALGTGLSVLAAVVYNLISDVTGGIELTVLEEDLRPVRAAAPAAAEADGRASRAEEPSLAPGYPA
jgi:hypothetical protein